MTTSTDPQAAALAVMAGPGGPFELGREEVLRAPSDGVPQSRPETGVLEDSIRHGDGSTWSRPIDGSLARSTLRRWRR